MGTTVVAMAGLVIGHVSTQGVIGAQRFDSSVNLVGGFSRADNLDGGPGDAWGIGGTRDQWFQITGLPFGLADDSVFPVSHPFASPFAADTEGVFGQARSTSDLFFGMSDSDEFGRDQVASWTFATGRARDLQLSIDLGGVANASSGGYTSQSLTFAYSIDGGAFVEAIRITAEENTGQFATRPMDSGNASGGGGLLVASGINGVTKINADTGVAVSDLFLDKATVGTGMMDTFTASLDGIVMSEITIRVTADMPLKAAAFDNIVLTPTPAAVGLAAFGGVVASRRRR